MDTNSDSLIVSVFVCVREWANVLSLKDWEHICLMLGPFKIRLRCVRPYLGLASTACVVCPELWGKAPWMTGGTALVPREDATICPFSRILSGIFERGGSGRRGIPHPFARHNVFRQWCCDTPTVMRMRHHLPWRPYPHYLSCGDLILKILRSLT